MSISNPECHNTHDTSSTVQIEAAISQFTEATVSLARDCNARESVVNDFEEAAKGLTSVVKEVASQSTQADSQASDNSDKIQSNSEQIEQLEEHSAKSRAELSSRVATIEQELDDMDASACSEGRGAGSSEENPHTSDEQDTPLERICALPESVVKDNLTKNQSRARSIARKIDEYGKSVPAGIAIPSSRIRRVLTAQEDSIIHRQTVARVADFLKQFGDGDVKIKKTRSGEKTVVFTEELVESVTGVVTPKEGDPVTQALV